MDGRHSLLLFSAAVRKLHRRSTGRAEGKTSRLRHVTTRVTRSGEDVRGASAVSRQSEYSPILEDSSPDCRNHRHATIRNLRLVLEEPPMAITVTVTDETTSGATEGSLSLDFLNETVSVRELIRERVYEEVRQYNATRLEYYRGLVQPDESEATLNGQRVRERRTVDWQQQFDAALKAFGTNSYFILVDDRQVQSLNETVLLKPATKVSFVKLVPMVGG